MRKLVCLAAAAILGVSCGATAIGSGSGSSPTPSPGGLGFDQVATDKDHDVSLHTGQKLEVVLHAGQGMNSWSHPASSDTSILTPIVDPAATAAIGVTLAAFQAQRPGEVDVTSNAGPKCSPGQACPMYLMVYRLRVVITP